MFYKSTYQENLSTSEAIKEVTLEEVTYGARGGGGGGVDRGRVQVQVQRWHGRIFYQLSYT